MMAIWAVVFSFVVSSFTDLEAIVTDFALELGFSFAVIEEEVGVRGIAIRAGGVFGDGQGFRATLDRRQGFTVFYLMFSEYYFEVFFTGSCLEEGFSVKGGLGST